MTNRYNIGETVYITGEFRNSANELADPDTVRALYTAPGGPIVTKVYNEVGSEDLVRLSQGIYKIGIETTTAGNYWYRMDDGGDDQIAEESYFYVRPSKLV